MPHASHQAAQHSGSSAPTLGVGSAGAAVGWAGVFSRVAGEGAGCTRGRITGATRAGWDALPVADLLGRVALASWCGLGGVGAEHSGQSFASITVCKLLGALQSGAYALCAQPRCGSRPGLAQLTADTPVSGALCCRWALFSLSGVRLAALSITNTATAAKHRLGGVETGGECGGIGARHDIGAFKIKGQQTSCPFTQRVVRNLRHGSGRLRTLLGCAMACSRPCSSPQRSTGAGISVHRCAGACACACLPAMAARHPLPAHLLDIGVCEVSGCGRHSASVVDCRCTAR